MSQIASVHAVHNKLFRFTIKTLNDVEDLDDTAGHNDKINFSFVCDFIYVFITTTSFIYRYCSQGLGLLS